MRLPLTKGQMWLVILILAVANRLPSSVGDLVKKIVIAAFVVCGMGAGLLVHGFAQNAPASPSVAETAQARHDFNGTCAGCHGDDAGGGDRAPALVDNPHLRVLDAA